MMELGSRDVAARRSEEGGLVLRPARMPQIDGYWLDRLSDATRLSLLRHRWGEEWRVIHFSRERPGAVFEWLRAMRRLARVRLARPVPEVLQGGGLGHRRRPGATVGQRRVVARLAMASGRVAVSGV